MPLLRVLKYIIICTSKKFPSYNYISRVRLFTHKCKKTIYQERLFINIGHFFQFYQKTNLGYIIKTWKTNKEE